MYTVIDRFKYVLMIDILIGGNVMADEFDELLEIQRRMQSRIVQEQQMDDELDVLAIITEMAPHPDQRLQKEAVIVEAGVRGFSPDQAEKIIEKLISDRVLFEPAEGFIQRR